MKQGLSEITGLIEVASNASKTLIIISQESEYVMGLKNIFSKYVLQIIFSTPFVHGNSSRIKYGKRISLANTVLNTGSGDIVIGDDSIFGHNVMLLTGKHDFIKGKRKKLVTGGPETPKSGYDIFIGSGCWIASGVIVVGGVSIGDNVIIGAGSIVTKNIRANVFASGVPAKIIKELI
jgi:acetyltransferase-like isoleucine patch superfamily enzyme